MSEKIINFIPLTYYNIVTMLSFGLLICVGVQTLFWPQNKNTTGITKKIRDILAVALVIFGSLGIVYAILECLGYFKNLPGYICNGLLGHAIWGMIVHSVRKFRTGQLTPKSMWNDFLGMGMFCSGFGMREPVFNCITAIAYNVTFIGLFLFIAGMVDFQKFDLFVGNPTFTWAMVMLALSSCIILLAYPVTLCWGNNIWFWIWIWLEWIGFSVLSLTIIAMTIFIDWTYVWTLAPLLVIVNLRYRNSLDIYTQNTQITSKP